MLLQHVAVEQYADLFHAEQHRDERLLDLFIDRLQARRLLKFAPQVLVQPERDLRVFGSVGRRLLEIDLVEGQLPGAFAGNILIVDRVDVEIETGNGVHIVSRCHAVQHVGLEHRVERHSPHADVVASEDVRVVLQVMANLLLRRILEPVFERRKDPGPIELVGRAGVIMRDRDIGSLPGFHRQ